jgi:transposase-like protein
MRKGRFTEEQIAFALKQAETGTPVAEVIRRMGVSEQTFYRWKKLYGGLGTGELRRLRQLYGVVTLDPDGRPVSLEEKPREPKSNPWLASIYDETAVERVKQVKPSARGEYEITDLSRLCLHDESLHVALLGRGFAWFDAGTHSSLLEAAEFVRVMQ